MTSGHSAGLLKGAQFGKELKQIKKKQKEEDAQMGAKEMGKEAETVYRDKRGRKLDMLEEMMRQQRIREGKEEKQEREEYEWGTGTKQKVDKKKLADEFAETAAAPFARYADDPKLEAMLKDKMRADDPMAQYIEKKRTHSDRQRNAKPTYKGPPGPGNRYGLRPGYRWDGVDRGSDFEQRLMKSLNEKSAIKNDYAAWSAADM
jgi:pre-mRNA-splicing factor CWC26